MKLRDKPMHTRPREKLIEHGSQYLSDAELLAVLLRTGYKGKNAVEVAERLLTSYPLKSLLTLPYSQLAKLKGIGPARATTLHAVQEISQRIDASKILVRITSPEDVYKVALFLRDRKKEHLFVLMLNARSQLISSQIISVGTLTANLVHPREVFKPAIEEHASHIIIVHNHPSGDSLPSSEDIEVTKRLYEAGSLLGIELVDHVVIAKENFCSLKEFCKENGLTFGGAK